MLPPLTPEWPERAGRRSRGCYPHQSHAVSCVWLRGALAILYIATLVMLGKRVGLYVSLDVSKCERLLAKYPDLQGLRIKNVDPEESARCYQLLDQRRGEIGEELYAYCLRELLKSSTRGVSRDCRLRMLEGVRKEDIMFLAELEALSNLISPVRVYRGAPYSEDRPGLSWSLRRSTAEGFFGGRLFEAETPKDSIIAYFADQNEEEVLVDISEYKIVEEDEDFGLTFHDKVRLELERMDAAGLIG